MPSRFEISDELWAEVEPLIPVRERRRRYPGRKAIDDRLALNGILHVLHTGIAWEDLPREYGYGSGVTCWRRLRTWQKAGVWDALHQKLLVKLNAAGKIDWSRASVDASHIRALPSASATAQQSFPKRRLPWLCGKPILAQWQFAVASGGQHALGVGVATVFGVSLRSDQHVLAQRR